MWSLLAQGIGFGVLGYIAYSIAVWVYVCFLRPGKDLKKEGEWAVVTGATDGIGKAVAKELIKKGLKVLLISRTPERLAETAKELGADKTETLAIDFGKLTEEKCKQIKDALAKKDVGVLVNNVGVSYDHPAYFHELDEKLLRDIISINIESCVWMSHAVLPQMLEKKRGCIVNVSSSSAVNSCPMLAEYSAAKEFVVRFSQSLACEYAGKNIKVQAQVVHFVTTKLAKIRKPSLTTPTPENFATASVKAMGHPEAVISPYWSHYVVVSLMRNLPTAAADKLCMMLHSDLRKRALNKKEAAAKSN